MYEGPNIARIASLIGEPARAHVLAALLSGTALTATELAEVAGVTRATVSAHLAKLLDARLLAVESQGRHRYFRLADADVAHALESLMDVAARTGAMRARPGPRDPALRRARVCYDHLAGEVGVQVYESLVAHGLLRVSDATLELCGDAQRFFAALQIDVAALACERRPLARACLDWSVRRHHLAGAVGAALLARCLEQGWARRVRGTRVVSFTPPGEAALRLHFAPPPVSQPALSRHDPIAAQRAHAAHAR